MGGISERAKEIKRRRHRRKKLNVFSRKLVTANNSERSAITEKIRNLTPGALDVIANWQLGETNR